MTLEPRVQRVVRVGRALGPVDPSVPMAVRRGRSARQASSFARLVLAPAPRSVRLVDRVVPVSGGRVRVRFALPPTPGPHPLYVFLHGGGWCVGTLEERDPRCATVAHGADCIVASVDYRLAPENQFPTAPLDCYAVLCELVDHAAVLGIDPTRVAVGGESAGGNLAAVVCLLARDGGGPALCHQWLDVPATDVTLSQEGHRAVPDGYLLDKASIDDFLANYLRHPEDALDPRCSPLLAPDLSGLPPAWIMTAEYDRLRGDGLAYADALMAAGVPARHIRLRGHVHGSFALTRLIPSARAYERDAVQALATAFGRTAR